MDEITITVGGRSGTGKTTIANLITKALKLNGINPEIVLGLNHEYEDDLNYHKNINALIEKGTKIKIQEKQYVKSFDDYKKARDWFHNLLMGVEMIKKENNPESLFFKDKDNEIIMEQDYKNGQLWVSCIKIWSVLRSECNLSDQEISDIIKDMMGDIFKIKVSTPHNIK